MRTVREIEHRINTLTGAPGGAVLLAEADGRYYNKDGQQLTEDEYAAICKQSSVVMVDLEDLKL